LAKLVEKVIYDPERAEGLDKLVRAARITKEFKPRSERWAHKKGQSIKALVFE